MLYSKIMYVIFESIHVIFGNLTYLRFNLAPLIYQYLAILKSADLFYDTDYHSKR